MENLSEVLEGIGLKDTEARVYLALLERGDAIASRLAERTKIKRPTVYLILKSLTDEGLVSSYIKRGVTYFSALPPKGLIEKYEVKVARAKRALPELESLVGASGSRGKPKVRYFEGARGAIAAFEDMIHVDKPYEMLCVVNFAKIDEFLPDTFYKLYLREKEKMGIRTRSIFPDTPEDRAINETRYAKIRDDLKPVGRYVPMTAFSYKSEFVVYGEDKILLLNFTEGEFAGIVIEDQTIHGMMKMIFELAWKGADK